MAINVWFQGLLGLLNFLYNSSSVISWNLECGLVLVGLWLVCGGLERRRGRVRGKQTWRGGNSQKTLKAVSSQLASAFFSIRAHILS
jgi:hypothetical protein